MKSFFELAKHRRSIRKYKDTPVEEEKVERILQSALMSPASKRSNGWEFIVVDDKALLQELSACRDFGTAFVGNAPLAIVVAADPAKSDVWYEDASIASIIIQFAAADLGLGSCWAQVYGRMKTETSSSESHVRSVLNIPESLHVLNIIGIGYADEERKPYDEEKLSYNKIHRNQFKSAE